jgi:hypothetical protein
VLATSEEGGIASRSGDDQDVETKWMVARVEIEPCLRYWLSQRPITRESVHYVFALLPRVLHALSSSEGNDDDDNDNRKKKATEWLNAALDHWRLGIASGSVQLPEDGMPECDSRKEKHRRRQRHRHDRIDPDGTESSSLPASYDPPLSIAQVWDRLRAPLDAPEHLHGDAAFSSWYPLADAKTYGILISAIAASVAGEQRGGPSSITSSTSFALPELATRILDHCLEHGLAEVVPRSATDGDKLANCSPVVLWNATLLVWAKHGKAAAGAHAALASAYRALNLLRRMKDRGMRPNQVTYATILQALSHAALAETSEPTTSVPRRWKKPASSTIAATTNVVDAAGSEGAAVTGFGIDNCWAVGMTYRILDEMRHEAGMVPNDVCWLHALQALVNARRLDEAREILDSCVVDYYRRREASLTSESESFSSILQYPRGDNVYSEDEHDQRIDSNGAVKPSRQVFGVVMSGYAKQGLVSDVVLLYRDLQRLYSQDDHDDDEDDGTQRYSTLNFVLQAMAESRTLESASRAHEVLESVLASATDQDTNGGRPFEIDTACYNTVRTPHSPCCYCFSFLKVESHRIARVIHSLIEF